MEIILLSGIVNLRFTRKGVAKTFQRTKSIVVTSILILIKHFFSCSRCHLECLFYIFNILLKFQLETKAICYFCSFLL